MLSVRQYDHTADYGHMEPRTATAASIYRDLCVYVWWGNIQIGYNDLVLAPPNVNGYLAIQKTAGRRGGQNIERRTADAAGYLGTVGRMLGG